MPQQQESGLRESLDRWNQSRTQHSQGFNEGAKTIFASWADSLNGRAQDIYQRLPLTQQDLEQDQEPEWFSLSRTERLALFVCCILGSAGCFTLCVFLFPVLAAKPPHHLKGTSALQPILLHYLLPYHLLCCIHEISSPHDSVCDFGVDSSDLLRSKLLPLRGVRTQNGERRWCEPSKRRT
ncbi:Protein transport protein SFT2 [Lachancea thermotolerans]